MLTRKRTKKRLARLGLDATASAGQLKRETVFPGQKRFKANPHKTISFAENIADESSGVGHHIDIVKDGEARFAAARKLYENIRRKEAGVRRKELIAFVVDDDKAVRRTPRLLGIKEIWRKVKSNRHKEINSGKQRTVRFKGCGLLHSQLTKADIQAVMADIKSGKTSLVITSDEVGSAPR